MSGKNELDKNNNSNNNCNKINEKVGIIDVGGGMRGIYGAGIFDYLIDNNIEIPYCIGVSAGSANVASYISKQKGRNKPFYQDYSYEKKYMSFHNLLHKGSYIDLDYIYGTLSNEGGRNPWDFDKAMASSQEMVVAATDAKKGKPKYFTKKDYERNDYGMLKASSCIPIVCKAYKWKGGEYFDGALTDPIPYKKAIKDGCTRVIVVLTRPIDYRKQTTEARLYHRLKKSYPNMVEKMYARCDLYNTQLEDLLENYVPSKKAFVIGPDDVCNVDTLKRTKENMEKLYQKGYKDGEKIEEYLKQIQNWQWNVKLLDF